MADRKVQQSIVAAYGKSRRSLLLLDYDGTLVPFASRPERAVPGRTLMRTLEDLSSRPRNELAILSGRSRAELEWWFGRLDIHLVAEHGAWMRRTGEKVWRSILPLPAAWKAAVRPVFGPYLERVPGSFLEEKDFSLAWHYRNAPPATGRRASRKLATELCRASAGKPLEVLEGSKVVEVKNKTVDKGRAALRLIGRRRPGFILAMGDDRTDEDMFSALPDGAFTIKVGPPPSGANFFLPSRAGVLPFLRKLIAAGDGG